MNVFWRLTYIVISIACMVSVISGVDVLNSNVPEKTCLKKVADINMASFDWKRDSWSTNTFVEFMTQYRERRLNPLPRVNRSNVYALFEEVEKQQATRMPIMSNDQGIWKDLELFCGKRPEAPFLAKVVDRTQTEYGKVKFLWMLAQPLDDREVLKERQTIIRLFTQDHDLMDKLVTQLAVMKKTENVILSFWDDDMLKSQLERHMFPVKFLNEKTALLTAGSYYYHTQKLIGLGITAFVTGALALYGTSQLLAGSAHKHLICAKQQHQSAGGFGIHYAWKRCEQVWPNNCYIQALFAGVTAMTCGLSMKGIIDNLHGGYLFEDLMMELMHQVSQSITAMRVISQLITTNDLLRSVLTLQPLPDLFVSNDKAVQEFLQLMESPTLQGKPSFIAHKGNVLRAFYLMHEVKDQLVLAFNAVAELDVYASCSTLLQEFSEKPVRWCCAQYNNAETPHIDAHNFWHPMINEYSVVPNSIQIGMNETPQNIVITGPNAGGKSTILKALAVAIMFAQTFGIAPAERFILTPFSSIATYLNITDDIGSGNSLYKAEVLRVNDLVKRVEQLQPGQFSFALFDEVFSGTSPEEGAAAAYSIINELSKNMYSINLISTHFKVLTTLAEKNNRITNCKVSVSVEHDGTITYPFKLEPGISHQHVAIDILRNEGVNSRILDDAQEFLRRSFAF